MSTAQSKNWKAINLMIVIKVKNIKTNSRLQRQLYAKCQSFIQLIGGKAYVELTLEMYVLQSLQGRIFRLPFFNPVFKNTRIR